MIQKERIHQAKSVPFRGGRYILYWMQASQRTRFNHALEYAVAEANRLDLPLVVGFVLTGGFPEANLRHYTFMLEGLANIADSLKRRGIAWALRWGDMVEEVLKLAANAALVVSDAGYLRIQRQWRREVAERLNCSFTLVESDVVVPVAMVSDKEEIGARTLRPKIHRCWGDFLQPLPELIPRRSGFDAYVNGIDIREGIGLLEGLLIDRRVAPVHAFKGGQDEARRRLRLFIETNLVRYHELSRDPAEAYQSDLSPYLHFGHISPVEAALEVMDSDAPPASKEAFLEQLIVRRELSANFAHYNPYYDRYEGAVPGWAKESLKRHRADQRTYLYTLEQLEEARTHDEYWNAAQKEMSLTGKMHNYMRMYWGKKIIEWTESPEEAFRTMLYLNNKYELDGRDPNGFAGVAWCFGKHDRPWQERPVFGKVRYMNAQGLERKFKIADYVKRIESIEYEFA